MSAITLKGRAEPAERASQASYDRDFYSWTMEQAAALRSGRLPELDVEHLAEEIEDLGKEVFSKLRSSFRVILVHMLKWDHQPERRSRSWAGSIKTHRIELEVILAENPALRRRQGEAVAIAYRQARVKASVEMKRSEQTLPETCPYPLGDILERPFEWPQD